MPLTRLRLAMLCLALVFMATLCPTRGRAQTCTVSATAVAFGTYSTTSGTADDSVGATSVSCSATISLLVSYTVALSAGNSGVYTTRTMSSGANSLSYQLYTSSARSQVWGDGTGGTGTVSSAYLLQALVPNVTNISVYGRIPAHQNAAAGTYLDTILVSVTY